MRFHVAHSPQREVEILHDQLLARFDADPTLRPRDVIVMVPDINPYAPHIEAVFGQIPRDDKRFIPYTLADQGQRGREPLLVALEHLLRLPDSRFAVSEILDLLDVAAVRARFGLADADLPLLRRWIDGAGVRWGLDGQQRERLGLPAAAEANSWRFGLRRMLLGFAVGEGEAFQGIQPYAEIGGLDAAALGPLAGLLGALEEACDLLAEEADAATWVQRLRALLEDFFLVSDDHDELLRQQLLNLLEGWLETCGYAGFSDPLPLSVVREAWLGGLDAGGLNQRFLAGAVSFCTLMPMRAIPFQLVCLLGMNDGDYPRPQSPLDFDLMRNDYRPGDRSRREDDRYLLLEALLSARRQLYVSWVGRSIRDNSERPPSVLIGQLRDHLAAGWRSADGGDLLHGLTLEHPLQPFSRAYFDAPSVQGIDGLYTYAREWRDVHREYGGETTEAPLSPPVLDAPIGLRVLSDFLANPVGAFFLQRLKVRFGEEQLTGQDEEPFELNGLDVWQLQFELCERLRPWVEQHWQADQLTVNGWNSVIGIVLNGTFYCSSAVGKRMIEKKTGGVMLNVIANYAWTGGPGVIHSASAKAGVLALTRTLAVEWARYKIRVNAIAPGPVHTPGASERLFPSEEIAEGIRKTIPLRRFANLEEIAQSASYLLSDFASYVTGENFVIDGGQWLSGADYFTRLKQMVPR